MLDKFLLSFFHHWQRNLETFGRQPAHWRSLKVWNQEQKQWEKLKNPTWNEVLNHCFHLNSPVESAQKVFGQPLTQFKQSLKNYRKGSWLKRWWLRLTQDMEKKDIAWRYYKNRCAFNEDRKAMLNPEQQKQLTTQATESQPSFLPAPTFTKTVNKPVQTWSLFGKRHLTTKTPEELKAEAIAQAEYQMSVWAARLYPKTLEALKKLYQNPAHSKETCTQQEQQWAAWRKQHFTQLLSQWTAKLFKQAPKRQKELFVEHCNKKFIDNEKALNIHLEGALAPLPNAIKGTLLRDRLYSQLKPEPASHPNPEPPSVPTLEIVLSEKQPAPQQAIDERPTAQAAAPVGNFKVPEPLAAPNLSTDLTDDEVKRELDVFYAATVLNIQQHSHNVIQSLKNMPSSDALEAKQARLKALLLPMRSSYRQAVLALHTDTHAKRNPSPDLTLYLNQTFNRFKTFYDNTITELEKCLTHPEVIKQAEEASAFAHWLNEIFKEDIAEIEKLIKKSQEDAKEAARMMQQMEETNEQLSKDWKKLKSDAEDLHERILELGEESERQFEYIDTKHKKLTQDIKEFNQEAQQEIKTLNAGIETLQHEIKVTQDKTKAMDELADILESKDEAMQNEIKAMQSEIRVMRDETKAMNMRADAIFNETKALNIRADAIYNETKTMNIEADAMQNKIEELKTMQTEFSEIQDKFAETTEKFEQVVNERKLLVDELMRQHELYGGFDPELNDTLLKIVNINPNFVDGHKNNEPELSLESDGKLSKTTHSTEIHNQEEKQASVEAIKSFWREEKQNTPSEQQVDITSDAISKENPTLNK